MVQIPMSHWSNLFHSQDHSTVKGFSLLTTSRQPAKDIQEIYTYRGKKWIFINGHRFTHWIKTIFLSLKMAMDAVYVKMMDRLLHMNKQNVLIGFHWSI